MEDNSQSLNFKWLSERIQTKIDEIGLRKLASEASVSTTTIVKMTRLGQGITPTLPMVVTVCSNINISPAELYSGLIGKQIINPPTWTDSIFETGEILTPQDMWILGEGMNYLVTRKHYAEVSALLANLFNLSLDRKVKGNVLEKVAFSEKDFYRLLIPEATPWLSIDYPWLFLENSELMALCRAGGVITYDDLRNLLLTLNKSNPKIHELDFYKRYQRKEGTALKLTEIINTDLKIASNLRNPGLSYGSYFLLSWANELYNQKVYRDYVQPNLIPGHAPNSIRMIDNYTNTKSTPHLWDPVTAFSTVLINHLFRYAWQGNYHKQFAEILRSHPWITSRQISFLDSIA